jgi:hypothetical protein
LIATSLAACVTSNGPAPVTGSGYRVALPAAPAGVEACLRRAFPEIPDRALTKADVVRIIGEAKVLDRSKTACGERAVSWIRDVRRDLAK